MTQRKRILLVGSTGTIGRAVAAALSPNHEVVGIARRGVHGRGRGIRCLGLDDGVGCARQRDRAVFRGRQPVLPAQGAQPDPRAAYTAISMANAAVDAFCTAAALELPGGARINSVAPVSVLESLLGGGISDTGGYDTQTAAETALGYVAAVEGDFPAGSSIPGS